MAQPTDVVQFEIHGSGQWLYKAIENITLLCADDGSYMREIHPNLCAAAVIIKCSSGGGRLSLSFTDTSPGPMRTMANYWG